MLNFLRFLFGRYFWIQCGSELAYKGQWKSGRFNGYGHLKYKNGSEYIGQFVDGVKHGKGWYSSSSGYEYEGDWLKGKQSGAAKIQYKNGDVYTGEVKDSLRDGFGELYQVSSTRNFKGCWDKDNLKGEVEIKEPKWTFKGKLDFQKSVGQGVLQYQDGSEYRGNIQNFKRHGKGQLQLKMGQRITGIWNNNINVESATIIDEHGFTWRGQLKNLLPNGRFDISRPDGIVYQSIWSEGQILEALSVERRHLN